MPAHGDEFFLQVALTAADAGDPDLTTTTVLTLLPRTAPVTPRAELGGPRVAYNGVEYAAPVTLTSVVGDGQVIGAPSPRAVGGGIYAFERRSDGGARDHAIVVGEAAVTYTATFAVADAGPPPTIGGLLPDSATAGGGAFDLTVEGTGLAAGAVVRWDGADRPTTAASPTRLTARIAAADIAAVGTARVTVALPDGRVSAPIAFPIAPGAPIDCPPERPFRAEYFANRALSGAPALVRREARIGADWRNGAPAPGLPADTFSVRWSGAIDLAAGTYAFTAAANDGIRAWLDGRDPAAPGPKTAAPIIDAWPVRWGARLRATRALAGGAHALCVEFHEGYAAASASLTWRPA